MGGIFLTVMYNNAPFCRSVWMEEQKKKKHLSIHLFTCNYPGFGSGGSRLNGVFPDTPILKSTFQLLSR